jgi:hypothetical protein
MKWIDPKSNMLAYPPFLKPFDEAVQINSSFSLPCK